MEKYKEPKDICIHNNDRWNHGCEMCDALNSLANKNVTLQKLTVDDFKLTEDQMKQKYHISNDDIDNQGKQKPIFPKYIPEGDSNC